MQILELNTKDLIPYSNNNRKHPENQVRQIAGSIKKFGFIQPLVIDKSKTVIIGHGRLMAALELGMATVPCIRLENLSEANVRALRIIDNKLQNDSEWDYINLEIEIGALHDVDFDLEEFDLDDLLPETIDDEIGEDGFTAPTNSKELPETFIQLGDLIELGQHRVMCGDSTDAANVKTLLSGAIPTVMCTDPPYGIKLDQSKRSLNPNHNGGNPNLVLNDHIVDWSEAYNLFPGDIVYLWHAGIKSPEVFKSLSKTEFEPNQQIIWVKNALTIGRADYQWKHEPCLYAVRKNKTHSWIGDRSQTTVIEAISINNPNSPKNGEDRTNHPTQKPIACMYDLIKNHSGDVYDPFLGSGTTLIAADKLKKQCFGFELHPQYCHIIAQRWLNHCRAKKKPFICKVNGKQIEEAIFELASKEI